MKKTKTALLTISVLLLLASCGPRRYKCGPYRRCEIKTEKQFPIKEISSLKSETTIC